MKRKSKIKREKKSNSNGKDDEKLKRNKIAKNSNIKKSKSNKKSDNSNSKNENEDTDNDDDEDAFGIDLNEFVDCNAMGQDTLKYFSELYNILPQSPLNDVTFVFKNDTRHVNGILVLFLIQMPRLRHFLRKHIEEKRDNYASRRGIFQLPDVDYDTFLWIKDYVYNRNPQLTPKNVCKILVMADKYQIKYVRNACIKYITQNLLYGWKNGNYNQQQENKDGIKKENSNTNNNSNSNDSHDSNENSNTNAKSKSNSDWSIPTKMCSHFVSVLHDLSEMLKQQTESKQCETDEDNKILKLMHEIINHENVQQFIDFKQIKHIFCDGDLHKRIEPWIIASWLENINNINNTNNQNKKPIARNIKNSDTEDDNGSNNSDNNNNNSNNNNSKKKNKKNTSKNKKNDNNRNGDDRDDFLLIEDCYFNLRDYCTRYSSPRSISLHKSLNEKFKPKDEIDSKNDKKNKNSKNNNKSDDNNENNEGKQGESWFDVFKEFFGDFISSTNKILVNMFSQWNHYLQMKNQGIEGQQESNNQETLNWQILIRVCIILQLLSQCKNDKLLKPIKDELTQLNQNCNFIHFDKYKQLEHMLNQFNHLFDLYRSNPSENLKKTIYRLKEDCQLLLIKCSNLPLILPQIERIYEFGGNSNIMNDDMTNKNYSQTNSSTCGGGSILYSTCGEEPDISLLSGQMSPVLSSITSRTPLSRRSSNRNNIIPNGDSENDENNDGNDNCNGNSNGTRNRTKIKIETNQNDDYDYDYDDGTIPTLSSDNDGNDDYDGGLEQSTNKEKRDKKQGDIATETDEDDDSDESDHQLNSDHDSDDSQEQNKFNSRISRRRRCGIRRRTRSHTDNSDIDNDSDNENNNNSNSDNDNRRCNNGKRKHDKDIDMSSNKRIKNKNKNRNKNKNKKQSTNTSKNRDYDDIQTESESSSMSHKSRSSSPNNDKSRNDSQSEIESDSSDIGMTVGDMSNIQVISYQDAIERGMINRNDHLYFGESVNHAAIVKVNANGRLIKQTSTLTPSQFNRSINRNDKYDIQNFGP